MASREELEAALRAADKAGNEEDARALAKQLSSFTHNRGAERDEVLSEYHSWPWYRKAGQSFDDAARLIASGMTGGWSDNLAGNLPGGRGSPAAEKQATDEARIRMGMVSMPYEFMGMLVPSSKISQATGAALNVGGRGVGESMLREGVSGMIEGGLMAGSDVAAGRGDAGDILSSGATGMAGGMAGGALGAKSGEWLDWAGRKLGFGPGAMVDDVVPPRSVGQLTDAADEAYDAVKQLGTRYDKDEYLKMVQGLGEKLNKMGIDPEFHPNVAHMLNKLQREGTRAGDLSPQNIDNMRRLVTENITQRNEGRYAREIKTALDNFIEKGITISDDAAAGTSANASAMLKEARDLNRRKRTLEDIQEALFKGDNAASSRGDINALRTLLNNPKKRRGMSKDELDALMKVVRGDKIENALRQTVGGVPITPIGAGVVAGTATSNPTIGLLAGGATALAEPLAEGAARKYTDANIKSLINTVSGGSVTPSMSKRVLPSAAQALGVLALEEDQRRTRKRKSRRD